MTQVAIAPELLSPEEAHAYFEEYHPDKASFFEALKSSVEVQYTQAETKRWTVGAAEMDTIFETCRATAFARSDTASSVLDTAVALSAHAQPAEQPAGESVRVEKARNTVLGLWMVTDEHAVPIVSPAIQPNAETEKAITVSAKADERADKTSRQAEAPMASSVPVSATAELPKPVADPTAQVSAHDETWFRKRTEFLRELRPIRRVAQAVGSLAAGIESMRQNSLVRRTAYQLGRLAAVGTGFVLSCEVVDGADEVANGLRPPASDLYRLNGTGKPVTAASVLNARGQIPRNYYPDVHNMASSSIDPAKEFLLGSGKVVVAGLFLGVGAAAWYLSKKARAERKAPVKESSTKKAFVFDQT